MVVVSIHAPRAEGDGEHDDPVGRSDGFNPRPPRGGRPAPACQRSPCGCSFNPRPPRGGRPDRAASLKLCQDVSIHAPRAEGDASGSWPGGTTRGFNPRPPRGGRRPGRGDVRGADLFQSTPPARRATPAPFPRSERAPVSIHAPRAEGDTVHRVAGQRDQRFQSTPPARRATAVAPRLPPSRLFQSTPPARRATFIGCSAGWTSTVSIHAPRAEGDRRRPDFQHGLRVSIHAPRAEGDSRRR